MVRIEKQYVFEGPSGQVGLSNLFDGCRQLVLQHFMFAPDSDAGCSSCTAGVDEMSAGLLQHLRARHTAFVLVSRAPYAKLQAYAASRGWDVAWYSSYGSDFNYDFHVTLDPSVAPVEFNYRDADELTRAGLGWLAEGPGEQPGVSCFLRDGDAVFHTYSTFNRGTEKLGGAYSILDITALGRQEEWEEPKGRAGSVHGNVPNFVA
jgi:predicted dithiol-disulfide oxidoreductase (DUF899 family)